MSALRIAQGLTDQADASAVKLTRRTADGGTTTTTVDIEAYLQGKVLEKDLPTLQPGDEIEVPKRAAQ